MTALKGIRVLDLTHAHAGPICTLYMAAMGADVIKIEPKWGEMTRMFPPLVKGQSPYFLFLGRGKKGVTLDLKNPEGNDIFKELVKDADVVMENFSPGTMDRLGLEYDVLKEINPRIIYACISGFGHTGPWVNRRSFDPIAQAASGYMWLMKDAIAPDGPPLQAPEAIADTVPGFSALIGILAALVSRTETGRGQKVDVAQMDAMIGTMQSFSFWNIANMSFRTAGRTGRVGVSGLRETSDGYVMFALPPGRITDWFMELLGIEELTQEIVDKWVKERTTDDVVETLEKTGVPVAAVMDLDEVQACPQAKAREMFVKVNHPTMGEIIEPGFPIKVSETKGDISAPAPLLGEHNVEVYKRLLGYSEEKIEELRKKGVI
ncbi:CoA transferase [Candidatus Bathyarchaeota archaeon]|nr:MAG: CoA transferase [Candidatus Bathyarchaeota archaeon]